MQSINGQTIRCTMADSPSDSKSDDDVLDLQPQNLTLGAVLGQVFGLDSQGNGRAIVNVAQDKKTSRKYALKRFFVDEASEEAINLIRHEIVCLRQLKHDHILSCLGSFGSPDTMEIWLVSPLMEMGSLRRVLDSQFPEGIPESAASPIIRDLLSALVHLHERGVVHRALKVDGMHVFL